MVIEEETMGMVSLEGGKAAVVCCGNPRTGACKGTTGLGRTSLLAVMEVLNNV